MDYSAAKIARFKWPVSVSHTVRATPEQIWSAMTAPGNLEDCHPSCEKNPVEKWPGVGSNDMIHYYNGWIFERKFVNGLKEKDTI